MYKKLYLTLIILFFIFNNFLLSCVEKNIIKNYEINMDESVLETLFNGYYNVIPIKNKPKLIWYFNNPPYPIENLPVLYKPIFNNSPLIYNGIIYFSDKEGNFYAVNTNSGQLIWKVHFENVDEITTPIICNEIIFIGVNNLGIIGLDYKSGKIVFRLNNNGDFIFPPIIIDSVIYFFTIKPSMQHLNIIFNAFDIKKERYIYKKKFPTNIKKPVFLISQDFLLFYQNYINEILYCFEIKSGRMRWKKEIQNIINKKILYDKNKVFLFAWDVNLKFYLIDINNGNILTTKTIDNINERPVNILLASDDKNIYAGINNLILIIDKKSGNIIRTIKIENEIGPYMTIVNDVLYISLFDIEKRIFLCAIDLNSEKILWKLTGYSLSDYSPYFDNNSIYIIGYSTVYKLSE